VTAGLPVVRSVPRWDVIRRGIVLAAAGLVSLVAGGVLYGGRDVAAVAAPAARGTIPGEARFDAQAGRYAILLDRLSVTGPPSGTAVAQAVCAVGGTRGRIARVRGSRQAVSTESGVARSIGSFQAPGGRTTVACTYADGTARSDARFVVARRVSSLTIAMAVLLALGLVLGAVAAAMITWAVRNPTVTRS
jgi:hypothetical protein